MKNRLLSLTAAVLFCLLQAGNVNTAFATQSHSDRFYAYTASGDPATDMARVAYAQNGRRQSDFGYTEAWCADFLCDCAKIVGQGEAIPFYGECHGLYNRIISAGGYEVSAPQTGDVVFYNWDHVGLMIDGSNCTSGNMNTSKVSKVETWYYKEICKGKTIRIVRPNYRGTQGYLDVNGWLDGNELVGNVAGYGTFDVYVNGSLLADDVNDFYKSVPAGSSYRVTDIRPAAGHVFSGALNNSFSGTVAKNQTSEVRLRFNTCVDLGDGFYATVILNSANTFAENDGSGGIVNSEVSELAYSELPKRIWHFERTDGGAYGGSYKITSEYDGRVLDAKDFGSENGSALILRESNDSAAERWYIGPDAVTWMGYTLGTAYGSMAVSASGSEPGSALRLWTADCTDDSQAFAIVRLDDVNIDYGRPAAPEILLASVDPEDPDNVLIEWRSTTAGKYDSRVFDTALCAGEDAGGVPLYANNGVTDTEWSVALRPGTYTFRVRAVNALYADLASPWHETVFTVETSRTVTCEANGGEGAPAAQTVKPGEEVTLPGDVPARSGYAFIGWAESAECCVPAYQPGDSFVPEADLTLYAVWKKECPEAVWLPAELLEIGAEAFDGNSIAALRVPDGCGSIGEGAFANQEKLVYALIPESVTHIGKGAFANCPRLMLYGRAGSAAERFAEENGLPFTALTDDWTSPDLVPVFADVTEEKWVCTRKTEDFTWEEADSGEYLWADYPAGYDTGHALWSAYEKEPLTAREEEQTRVEVSESEHRSYLYWHWTFVDSVPDSNRNVLVERERKTGVNVGGSVYRDFIFFDTFETEISLNPEGMGTNGPKSFDGMYSTYHHPDFNLPEYASWWWYRCETYRQTWTEYRKVYASAEAESDRPVAEGEGISDVRHLVKYRLVQE